MSTPPDGNELHQGEAAEPSPSRVAQAEFINMDPVRPRRQTRGRKRRVVDVFFANNRAGSLAYKLRRAHCIINESPDVRERKRLQHLLNLLAAIVRSCEFDDRPEHAVAPTKGEDDDAR